MQAQNSQSQNSFEAMETPNSPPNPPLPPIPSTPALAHRTLTHRVQPEPAISPGGHLLKARRKLIHSHPNKTSFLQNRLSRNYEIRQNALLLPAPTPTNQQVRPRIPQRKNKKSGSKYASDAKLSEAAAIHRRKLRSEDVEEEVEYTRSKKQLEREVNEMRIREKAVRVARAAVLRRTGVSAEGAEEADDDDGWLGYESDEEEKKEMTYSSSSSSSSDEEEEED